jgi:hypothetical protein
VKGQGRGRPRRCFGEAQRVIVACELERCVHCGERLRPRRSWHMRKTVQTLRGPLFVAGKSKECANASCSHGGQHYYASGVMGISLPFSTYGLDVMAFVGWRHEQEHRQLVEIQHELNERGVLINERSVGRLYEQFLALVGGMDQAKRDELAQTAERHGGVVWAVDGLQPEGQGTLLYLLYEALGGTAVAAIQLAGATQERLCEWLQPYQELPYPVLATLSDGEKGIIAALKRCWPDTPHQRCQAHFLNNLAEPVLAIDMELRQQMREELGGLAPVPEGREQEAEAPAPEQPVARNCGGEPPPLSLQRRSDGIPS